MACTSTVFWPTQPVHVHGFFLCKFPSLHDFKSFKREYILNYNGFKMQDMLFR